MTLPVVVQWRKQIFRVRLSMAATVVGLALAERMDGGRDPSCWPSTMRVAWDVGCDERTVRRALVELQTAGLLDVRRRGPRTSLYRARLLSAADLPIPPKDRTQFPVIRNEDRTQSPRRPDTESAHDRTQSPTEVAHRRRPGKKEDLSRRPSPSPDRSGRRDPIFDALVQGCGMDVGEVVGDEAKAVAVAAAKLRKLQPPPEPDEVLRRAEAWRHVYPTASITPTAIVRHWARLGSKVPRGLMSGGDVLRLVKDRDR